MTESVSAMKSLARISLAATLLLCHAAIAGTNWRLVGHNDEYQFYIAEGRIPSPPNSVWVMQSKLPPKDDQDIAQFVRLGSAKLMYESDCRRGQVRVVEAYFYGGLMGAGEQRSDYRLAAGSRQWSFPAPDTIDEVALKHVCRKKAI